MARPRATFPDAMVDEYHGGKGIFTLARQYRSSNHTIRRWLSERTIIRPQGVRPCR
jgi:hypothetical protein